MYFQTPTVQIAILLLCSAPLVLSRKSTKITSDLLDTGRAKAVCMIPGLFSRYNSQRDAVASSIFFVFYFLRKVLKSVKM